VHFADLSVLAQSQAFLQKFVRENITRSLL